MYKDPSPLYEYVVDYYNEHHKKKNPFIPMETIIPYAGKVYGPYEIDMLIKASLKFQLTSGEYTPLFEKGFAEKIGKGRALFVNSGSSANLLAISALASLSSKGNEVITVAAGFPTTVNPIIQNGLVPVFVDVSLNDFNINIQELENALSDKTIGVCVAHTLGIPCDVLAIQAFCKKHNLFFVEDACDALGSKAYYRNVGTFGDISTFSFFPAHHITTGEGGMVYTENEHLYKIMLSIRDWGRDCVCPSGKMNICGNQYTKQYGELPIGYDHRYVYSHIGYNLKATEMQAALGLAQLSKLEVFIQKRRENYDKWKEYLSKYSCLSVIESPSYADVSWFGCPVLVKDDAKFTRTELTSFLAKCKIETRNLFGGNLMRQPAYRDVEYRAPSLSYNNTDTIMNNAFFLGVYPGLTNEQFTFICSKVDAFISKGER